MTDEDLDRINRAEEIQRYTENRCEALEKENAELKAYNEKLLNSDIEKHNKIVELEKENAELKAQIEKMKRDVMECFGYEYNILVAKLLTKWEIKENEN